MRWLYKPADVHPRAHVMVTAASSARAIARTCAMQPHARPYLSLTHIYIYMYVYNITYICVCVCICTHIPSFLRAAIPTHVDTRACERRCVRALTRASAVPPRMTAAPHRRPAERVPPAVARRPGRKGGAYPLQRGDRGGVPRADVRVERRRPMERLRADIDRYVDRYLDVYT